MNSVAGTDTITASTNPVTIAYATYQKYILIPANTNTGAVTVNINSLGAKAITKAGSTALVAGDLVAGVAYWLIYDGTRFQATNIPIITLAADSVTAFALADSTQGCSMVNGTIAVSVAANAMTIAYKTLAGTDPTPANPILIPFLNATGGYSVVSVTAAQSLTVPNLTRLGTSNGIEAIIQVVCFNDTLPFLGVINLASPVDFGDDVIASSVAIGGGGNSAGVFYTLLGNTPKQMTALGYIVVTEATAGVWATAPTKVSMHDSIYNKKNGAWSFPYASVGTATTLDITIPSLAKRVDWDFESVSTNGTSGIIIQAGDAGGIENTSYVGIATGTSAGSTTIPMSSGFLMTGSAIAAAGVYQFRASIDVYNAAVTSLTCQINGARTDGASDQTAVSFGTKALSSAPLTTLRLTTAGGANVFDGGNHAYTVYF